MSDQPQNAVLNIDMPNTDGTSDIPKKDKVSARKIASFITDQYHGGLQKRKPHGRAWLAVQAIMRGVHHFKVVGGVIRPLRPDPKGRKIHAKAPMMLPKYRVELGRLNANTLGVSAMPKLGKRSGAFQMAKRAQAIMDDWSRQVRLQEIYDEQNQWLLQYGGVALHPYVDEVQKQVFVEPVPQTQIFPIPFDAVNPRTADGLMRVQAVTKQFLEMQDEKIERQLGNKNFPHMATGVSDRMDRATDSTVGMASFDAPGGTFEGALLITWWLKGNDLNPSGQKGVMVNDRLYRYVSGYDDEGFSLALLNGTKDRRGAIPLEMIYHTKTPDTFWASGFCEALIEMQRERNRQLGYLIRNQRDNRSFMGFNPSQIDPKNILNDDSMLIPINSVDTENRPPLWQFPAQKLGREQGLLLSIVNRYADEAVNHESGILFGQQEGRTEGGPATELLNANAQAPLRTVVKRIFDAWLNTYPEVLNLLRRVWPADKVVRSSGDLAIASETKISKEQVPWAEDIILRPTPLLAGGRDELLQTLFSLRNMPADDGNGSELSSHELRTGMRMIGMDVPGVEIASKPEQRIKDRIALAINDGNEPGFPNPMDVDIWELWLENHRLAIDLIKEAVLDISFRHLSEEVRDVLRGMLAFHKNALDPPTPDNFDDDLERTDSLDQETFLSSSENDLSGFEGQFDLEGIPVGAR